MRVVISTNGTLITAEKVARLKEVGVSYVGISIDGRPATHDKFRGMLGAFEASMAAIKHCQDVGLNVGLRYTLTRANIADLPWLFELMVERDVHRLCIYHLAPTGRGAKIQGFAPSSEETRAAVDTIFERTRALDASGFHVDVLTADNHADAVVRAVTIRFPLAPSRADGPGARSQRAPDARVERWQPVRHGDRVHRAER